MAPDSGLPIWDKRATTPRCGSPVKTQDVAAERSEATSSDQYRGSSPRRSYLMSASCSETEAVRSLCTSRSKAEGAKRTALSADEKETDAALSIPNEMRGSTKTDAIRSHSFDRSAHVCRTRRRRNLCPNFFISLYRKEDIGVNRGKTPFGRVS